MKRIVIVLVVLAGLLVGADFAAAAFAEHAVSQKAREQLGLDNDPAVNIHGFPFTVQAVSGKYDHITVAADGVPVQDILRDVSINAELYDVTAPLSDLRAGNVDNIAIGEVEGQVTLKASDLAHVPPLNKMDNLRIDPSSKSYVYHGEDPADTGGTGPEVDDDAAQPDEFSEKNESTAGVRLAAEVSIAGRELEVFAFGIIELNGTTISITPYRIQYGDDQETTVAPQEVQQALLPNFEVDINTGDLPFAVTPQAISVAPGSLTVKGQAHNVTFSGAAQPSPQE